MICTGIGQYQQLAAHSPVSLLVNFEGSLHHTSGLNTGAENILFVWGVPTFQNALHVLQIAAYQTNTVPLSNIKNIGCKYKVQLMFYLIKVVQL